VPISDTISEPMQPSRFEKKANIRETSVLSMPF
jgi:hypothetical protein